MNKLFFLLFPIFLFASDNLDDLLSLSLEELMEVEVTTVSKKETNAFNSSSSVYIITQEQIRRSGMTSIPELLRLVPGMHVGRISSNQWSVNSRAPNQTKSREIRIMIDGRDLYNSYFNGVYWDSVNVMLEDIERIEVIRGPGASLWGTNTAHGVVNIITKKASDTQGALVSVSVGDTQDEYVTSARYGFSHSKGDTRLYATRRQFDRSKVPETNEASLSSRAAKSESFDAHHMSQAGFVSNLNLNLENRLRLSGDVYKGESEEETSSLADLTQMQGANFQFLYESDIDIYSNIALGGYVDYFSRVDSAHNNKMRVLDINFQHLYTRANHSLIWGIEYKNSLNEFTHSDSSFTLAVSPEKQTNEVYSFFIQDDISFFDESFILTPGLKYGHNDYTGDTYQPSIRAAYSPNNFTTIWTSFTRSEAEPSRLAVDGYLDLNSYNAFCSKVGGTTDPSLGCIIPFLTGNIKSNIINTYELGYRQQISERLIIDNSIFYDDYMQEGNDGTEAKYIYGYELNTKYAATQDLRLELSYAYHYGHKVKSLSTPITNMPKHTISASSFYTYKEKTDFDVLYYFLGSTKKVSSYSRIDLRIEHRPIKNLSISITGQNLLESEHIESNYDTDSGNSIVQRAFIAKLTYQF